MGFIKRFAPFAIALSLGLFVTSFFVDISAPKFKRGHGKHKRGEYTRQLESKVTELERQNAELRSQIESKNVTVTLSNGEIINGELPIAPVPPPIPTIPVVPAVPHNHK